MDRRDILRRNLDRVIWNIERARVSVSEHHIVKIVAISKYSDESSIEELYRLGQRAFGENQVQQLEKRVDALDELPIEWHMVGTLQRNKINKLIRLRPSLIHSVDSLRLAKAISGRLDEHGGKISILLQINSTGEKTKSGVSIEEATDIYREISDKFKNLNLKGVMTIGATSRDRLLIQRGFEKTYRVYEELRRDGASICSMGMSGDYELAIKCGSNMVRIGSDIFKMGE
ncbi:MAG: YggS family pyridoxal phosphate-dependent enzyme [Epsilonproteobacteria bacterium]|nr:YggS family pyridoxal phosphate-dependent enzyme [Campylobacterota bacterium]